GPSVPERLGGDHEVEDVAAGAAVLLGERQAEEPGLPDLRDELERVPALVVEAAVVVRRALPLDEVAEHLAERLLVVRELEVHLSLSPAGTWEAGTPCRTRPDPVLRTTPRPACRSSRHPARCPSRCS